MGWLLVVLFFAILQTLFALPTDQQKPNVTTTTDLVNQQTEVVKRIIADQKQLHREYPIVTKKPAEIKSDEKPTFEEFALKCKQFLQQQTQITTSTLSTPITDKPHGPLVKPDLVSKTGPESRVSEPTDNKVKLIKFEPVILQKNILKDGQVLYYWHKSLPFPQYVAELNRNQQPRKPYPVYTTSSTTTTTTTTQKPTTEKLPEPFYGNQLRFIVPINYAAPEDEVSKYHSDFDQYAYYPKQLQPQRVTMEVPYQPRYPLLQTLVIPNKYMHPEGDRLGDVQV